MSPFSQLNLFPGRSTFNSRSRTNSFRRTCSPGIASPIRHASIFPKSTTSPKPKARSSASASVFSSLIRALKFRPKSKKLVQTPRTLSPARSITPLSPIVNRCVRRRLQRARSVPTIGTQNSYRRQSIASSGDLMEVDSDMDEGGSPVQYLYYDASENPFATPPCQTPVTHLSPMTLDNDGVSPTNSPESSVKNERKAVERSRMKTLQLLGPEACMAINQQYGDERRT